MSNLPADTPGFWVTSVSDITNEDVYIRGYGLRSLIGKLPFSAVTSLLIRGKIPTVQQSKVLDSILCSILDYSLQKAGTVAARCVASVNPQMAPALAAGILASGEYAVSPEDTGKFIVEAQSLWKASGESLDTFAEKFVADLRAKKKRVPGFGHPVFRGIDPRAQRLKDIAVEQGVWGDCGRCYEAIHSAFRVAAKKPDLVINDVGMIAVILAEQGFTPQEMAGLALLSTFPGLIAHISEELRSGVRGRLVPDTNAHFPRNRRNFEEDMKAAGWNI